MCPFAAYTEYDDSSRSKKSVSQREHTVPAGVWRYGEGVEDGEDSVILKHFVRWNVATDNLGENVVIVVRSGHCCVLKVNIYKDV